MVTSLSLMKLRLAQLCPDSSGNGSSVQFQCKRFPVDVERHLKLWNLRVATQRCFDYFKYIDSFDALSFRRCFFSKDSFQVSSYLQRLHLASLNLQEIAIWPGLPQR